MKKATHSSLRKITFPCCLAMVILAGCGKEKVDTGNVKPAAVEADNWPSPTDEECGQFARQAEHAASSGNVAALNSMIDWDVLLEKTTGGIDGIDDLRHAFSRGVKRQSGGSSGSPGKQIADAVSQGGSYQFLRIRGDDKRKRVLLRLLLPDDGGLNYHEYHLAKRPDGQVKALDIYTYLSAEPLSMTFRRAFLPAVASQQRSLIERLSKKDNEFVKHVDKLQRMSTALQAGQFQEVMNTYNSLPASLQSDKVYLLILLQAATQLDDNQYMAAIDKFRKSHSNDPCMDMVSMDGYLIRKQYDRALECIERLDKSVGGDPYLTFVAAGVHFESGDYQRARKATQEAIDQLPDMENPYWTMINITMLEGNFADTVTWLNRVEERFATEFEDFATIPEYAEFVKSPQYREWMRSR